MDNRYSQTDLEQNKHGIFQALFQDWWEKFYPDQINWTPELEKNILEMWSILIDEYGWLPQPLGFYTTKQGERKALNGWVVLERITKKELSTEDEKCAVIKKTAQEKTLENGIFKNENALPKVKNTIFEKRGTIGPLGSPNVPVPFESKDEVQDPEGKNVFSPMEVFKGRSVQDVLASLDKTFSQFDSLDVMRNTGYADCEVLGFDTEYYYENHDEKEGNRIVLSYQFAYFDIQEDLHEVIIMPTEPEKRLPLKLEYVISYIFNSLGIPPLKSEDKYWKLDVNSTDEQRKKYLAHNKKLFKDGKVNKLVIVCHNGIADLTTLAHEQNSEKYRVKSVYTNFLRYTSQVNKGVISVNSNLTVGQKDYSFRGVQRGYYFNASLIHRDTMNQTIGDSRSLESCANVIGLKKLPVSDHYKSRMDEYFKDYFYSFLEYGTNDSIITLLYFQALYGGRSKGFCTITGVSGKVLQQGVSESMGISAENEQDAKVEWDARYRGLVMKKQGFEMTEDGRLFELQGYEYTTHLGRRVHQMSQDCYKGGCNESFYIGLIEGETYDIDSLNAYPTAMCLLPLIDWSNPFDDIIFDRDLKLSMFTDSTGINPLRPGFFYVKFEYPENIYEGSLGILDNGNTFYPLSSEGVDGCFATTPEVYLALKMGAKVHCVEGFFLNYLLDDSGKPTSVFGSVLKKLVFDRSTAKQEYGKKSLIELILKVIANAGYGKVAQSVKPKMTWNSYKKSMEDLGCSYITSPVYASMITAIVRVQVKAAINELHSLGYKVYSVTTDGFITNAPTEVVEQLDLYGLAPFLRKARYFLTSDENGQNGNPRVWEEKHKQNTLINLTTRANAGVEESGVLAHGGFKTPYKSDSKEDRAYFIDITTSRTRPTEWKSLESTNLKDVIEKGKDFRMYEANKTSRFDFDFKRKPVEATMQSLFFKDREMLTFDSAPYKNIEEARKYKTASTGYTRKRALRTREDYELFKKYMESEGVASTSSLMKKDEIIRYIITGWFLKLWSLPYLEQKIKVQEKVDWVNLFRTKPINKENWKSWSKRCISSNIPDREQLEPYLTEMQNYPLPQEKEGA